MDRQGAWETCALGHNYLKIEIHEQKQLDAFVFHLYLLWVVCFRPAAPKGLEKHLYGSLVLLFSIIFFALKGNGISLLPSLPLPHPLEIPFPPARTVGFILITWLLVSPPQWILSALIKLKDSSLISIGLLRYHFPRLPYIFIKAPD